MVFGWMPPTWACYNTASHRHRHAPWKCIHTQIAHMQMHTKTHKQTHLACTSLHKLTNTGAHTVSNQCHYGGYKCVCFHKAISKHKFLLLNLLRPFWFVPIESSHILRHKKGLGVISAGKQKKEKRANSPVPYSA